MGEANEGLAVGQTAELRLEINLPVLRGASEAVGRRTRLSERKRARGIAHGIESRALDNRVPKLSHNHA